MRRFGIVLLVALLMSSVVFASNEPRLLLHLDGDGKPAAAGGTLFSSTAIYLSAGLSRAKKPVYLHLEGVRLAPDSEAEVYLVNPGSPRHDDLKGTVDPANYVGTVRSQGSATTLPIYTFDVRDSEATDHKSKVRTNLRSMAGINVALWVKRGHVTVDRIVLTTASQAAWLKVARNPENTP